MNVEKIMEIADDAKSQYDKRNSEMKIDELLVSGDHDTAFGFDPPMTEKGEIRVVAGDAYNLLNDAVSIIGSLSREVKVWPEKVTKKADEKSSQAEKFLEGVFFINNRRRGQDLVETCINHSCAHGWGVLHYEWDDAAEVSGDTYFDLPLIIKPIDARFFYPMGRDRYGRFARVIYAPKMKRW